MQLFLKLIILAIIYSLLNCEITYSQQDEIVESFEEFFSTNEGEESADSPTLPKSPIGEIQKLDKQQQEFISYNKATIIVLNKITAKSNSLVLNLKQPKYFGNIEITLHRCMQKTDLYDPDNIVLLSVIENKPDEDPLLIFQGWMFASSIGLSSLEHPIYEIFIKNCF